MKPVAAGVCIVPGGYAWFSCRSKVSGKQFDWLDFDPLSLALADSVSQRQRNHLGFLSAATSGQAREPI